jgi:hypothetical protein
MRFGWILTAFAHQELGFELRVLAKRDHQPRDVPRPAMPMSFSDVRGDGHRGATHLCREAKPFASGERVRDAIDEVDEIHRPLPGEQIATARNRRHAETRAAIAPSRNSNGSTWRSAKEAGAASFHQTVTVQI